VKSKSQLDAEIAEALAGGGSRRFNRYQQAAAAARAWRASTTALSLGSCWVECWRAAACWVLRFP
jgi:hypothetical protein